MAIIQISKQQQRSGNLVDLPQLSEAEFGWASDEKRLFIGKETPNENIEVLTSYSRIDFSQLEGSVGNLNISNTVANGQVLAYDGNNWVNRGGSTGGLITLGNVSNVKITGGAIGYVLQTDGSGNLSWTPKGTLTTDIIDLTPDGANAFGYGANTVIMEVDPTTPYSNGLEITISGVEGNSNANVNSEVFYVRLATDYPTSGNVILFLTDALDLANAFIDGSLEYDNLPNSLATATTALGAAGGGGLVGGITNSIQYNDGVTFEGDTDLTWNGSLLYVNGNANVGNLNATGTVTASILVSNIASGVAPPLTVTSTDKVVNLNADLLDGYDTATAATANTIVVRDANASIAANTVTTNRIVNGTSNIVITVSGNVSTTVATTERIRATTDGAEIFGNLLASNVYANSGTIGASLLTGTLTTAAQPNITSVGTLTSLAVTGNGTFGNVYANTGTIGASLLTGTLTTAAQPNITSVGTLTSLAVTGNITGANVTTSSYVIRSVGTAISAAGTIQGDSTLLAKDINVVSTVSAGQGVRLPASVAGMVIIVNNTSATALNVYPSTGAAINSLAVNAAYTHVAAASLQYYATSATQWYTIGATYS